MPSISLRAPFDGCAIQLDEPHPLPPNSRLLVTVLEPAEKPLQPWSELARAGLAAAYGDEEPDYSPEDLKNP